MSNIKIDYFKIGQFTDTKVFYVGRVNSVEVDESLRCMTSHTIIFQCLTKKEAQEFIKNYKLKVGIK